MTFTAGDTSATAILTGNEFFGGYTIAGQWATLSIGNNIGPIADTATGGVYFGAGNGGTWTPALSSTGATFTYSSQVGTWGRTASGGYQAYFSVALQSATGLGSGAVSITGLPVTCASRPAGSTLYSFNGFTGLSGTPWATTVGNSSSINLVQQGSALGGTASVIGTNLTNTSSIIGTVTCGLTK